MLGIMAASRVDVAQFGACDLEVRVRGTPPSALHSRAHYQHGMNTQCVRTAQHNVCATRSQPQVGHCSEWVRHPVCAQTAQMSQLIARVEHEADTASGSQVSGSPVGRTAETIAWQRLRQHRTLRPPHGAATALPMATQVTWWSGCVREKLCACFVWS